MVPIEEFPLSILIGNLHISFSDAHSNIKFFFPFWNIILDSKLFIIKLFTISPCSVNLLIPVLELYRINIIQRDNFVISQEMTFQFF